MPVKQWRTKEVAESINVNPSTVQRWIKYFQIPCEQNANGHYVLTEHSVELIRHIHSETGQGKKLKHISLEKESRPREKHQPKMIPSDELDDRFTSLLLHIDQLDRKLYNKADEVVEFQVLMQRKEINEMSQLIEEMTERIKTLEDQLEKVHKNDISNGDGNQMKKRKLAGIFSF